MKKLTGWSAIVAIPTAITGFYGQNVSTRDSSRSRSHRNIALILVIGGALYVVSGNDWDDAFEQICDVIHAFNDGGSPPWTLCRSESHL